MKRKKHLFSSKYQPDKYRKGSADNVEFETLSIKKTPRKNIRKKNNSDNEYFICHKQQMESLINNGNKQHKSYNKRCK